MSELREKIAQLMDKFGEGYDQDCAFCNEQWVDEATDRIITLIREALLSESDGYMVSRDKHVLKAKGDKAVAAFATRPWMEKVLDQAGLGEQGDSPSDKIETT